MSMSLHFIITKAMGSASRFTNETPGQTVEKYKKTNCDKEALVGNSQD
jgi:hypothetical protein